MNLLDTRPLRLRGYIVTVVKRKNRRVPGALRKQRGCTSVRVLSERHQTLSLRPGRRPVTRGSGRRGQSVSERY